MINAISGCDFSSWTGDLDYAKAKSMMRFAFIRASQGIGAAGFRNMPVMGFKDQKFDENWEGMRGIPRGATHFLDWCKSHYPAGMEIEFGKAQAEYVQSITEKDPGEIVDEVDYEQNDAAGGTWGKIDWFSISRTNKIFLAYCLRRKELTGKFPIVYCPGWVAATLKNATEGALWMPRYQFKVEALERFLTWDELKRRRLPESGAWPNVDGAIIPAGWRFWQYTSGLVGYNFGMKSKQSWARMDGDVFNGDEEMFSIFLGEHTIPTWPLPPPVTEDFPVITEPVVSRRAIVVAADGVNLRSGVGTGSPQWWLNGRKYVHPKGATLDVFEVLKDSAGNPWIRSGEQYACMKYGGVQLMEFV
jgi:GH25 family lysozyme M1 (1,4-beta-N-acetylmuramidase)